jgi:nucleoside-diphosphate-sugar epimerase
VKVLVTGGTGLVGSHLIFDLLQKGYAVRALKRRTSKTEKTLHVFSYYVDDPLFYFDKIEWMEGDVLDYYSIEDALKGVDYIFHCAGFVSFDPKQRAKVIQVNELGTANVVNAALDAGIKKLCHVSSIAALGRSAPEEIIDENTKWKTSKKNSVYAIAKFAAEREVWRGIEEGLNAVIVNPSIILGPADWTDGSARLFKTVFDGLKFYTDGINGFVDVRDVSTIMIKLTMSDVSAERFVLNADNVSYKDLLSKIADGLKVKRPQIRAARILSELAWRMEKVRSIVTGGTPFITKETASSANGKYYYSHRKLVEVTAHQFYPMDETINNTCRCFLKDFNKEL